MRVYPSMNESGKSDPASGYFRGIPLQNLRGHYKYTGYLDLKKMAVEPIFSLDEIYDQSSIEESSAWYGVIKYLCTMRQPAARKETM